MAHRAERAVKREGWYTDACERCGKEKYCLHDYFDGEAFVLCNGCLQASLPK